MVAKKKKSTAKKSTAKRSTAKKSTAKKSTAKKSTAKKKTARPKKSSKKISSKSKKDLMDKQILHLLAQKSNNSLLISEIEEELKLEPAELLLAVRRLEENTKVRSKLVMNESRWILAVKKIHDFDYETKAEAQQKLIWNPINDLPCFICPYARKCDEGQKQYNPRSCAFLTDWLLSSIKEENFRNSFHPEYDDKKKKKK